MSETPEGLAEDKIIEQLESEGWSDEVSNNGQYKQKVRLPDGREADFVLYIKRKPVAIIEAKRESKNPKNHFQQAINYAKVINSDKKYNSLYNVPFVFTSNGKEIYVDDLREKTPDKRRIRSFYAPRDISRKLNYTNPKEGHQWLLNNDYEDTDPELWENQQEALHNIKQDILDQKHLSLVTMATGSGKTRLAMALTYQLLDSNFVDRVLFVPDTEQLESDSLSDFKSYDPLGSEPFTDKYRVCDFDEYINNGDADVVVSTIQKAYYELDNNIEDRSTGEFDLIIADECHRGIYNKDEGYGLVLDYFDGIEIGLTATPHRKTVERYNNNETYKYKYDEALEDNHVVPFQSYVIKTDVTMSGISYEGEHYKPSEFGRKAIVKDTHQKVAEELIDYTDIKNDLTLVFAQNIEHANAIRDHFINVFRKKLDIDNPKDFVKTITSDDRHSDRALNNFDDKRRNPMVAVTVDMISTGVDIRPLNNIVFLRPVKSKILYNQMIGRGTRTSAEKDHFKIFDCLGLLEYHSETPPFNTTNVQVDTDKSKNKTDNGDGGISKEPKEIDKQDIDTIIKSHRAYPLRDRFVDAETYLSYVSTTIEENEDLINQKVSESENVGEASDKIEKILTDEWQYYNEEFILDATSVNYDNIYEYVSEILLGYNAIRDNAKKAKKEIYDKYDLNEEQEKWVEMFEERASLEQESISKRRLLKKPFSDHGGLDEALEVFTDPSLEKIVSEFNDQLISLNN